VLNAAGPLGNKSTKEITEAMAIIQKVKGYALEKPMERTLVDFCSGNALVPLIAAHLLPFKQTIAVDKRVRKGHYHGVQRFRYVNLDIYEQAVEGMVEKDTVVTCVHGCGGLSTRVVELFRASEADMIALMPCCSGQRVIKYPAMMEKKLGKYWMWSYELYQELERWDFDTHMIVDEHVLSPKNIVITSRRWPPRK
jgi:hypothetical protein